VLTQKSVSSRSGAKISLKRALFGVGFRFPILGEPLLLRVFSTPFGSREGRQTMPASSGEREHWYELGVRFRAVSSGDGPRVFLIHGWGGHAGQLAELASAFRERGFQPVLIDLPAHGASSGRTTNAHEASRAICAIASHLGQPDVVVAHSFGALATRLALDRGLQTSKLVFVAPLPSLRWAATDFARQARIRPQKMLQIAGNFAAKLGLDLDLVDLSSGVHPGRPPLLVIHDQEDRRIPFAESERIVAAWPRSSLTSTSGLGHTRILVDSDVREQILRFALEPQAQAGASDVPARSVSV
jgi:pimeloyl-ACP methyl ester carboxylesterase